LFVGNNPFAAGLVAFIEGGIGHLVGGYRQFDGWPRFTTMIHQRMYVDWIRRAYEGGLRLMVAFVVDNALLASASSGMSYSGDRAAVETQIRATKELVSRHYDFMEIAYSPSDARRIIGRDNKLALVLGVEVDSLGDWSRESDVSDGEVADYLRRLYRIGVRHIFPIHLVNNAFGGAALYNDLFNGLNLILRGEVFNPRSAEVDFRLSSLDLGGVHIPDYGHVPGGHVNVLGLTARGNAAVQEMMRLGMVIDVDHMSWASVDDTLTVAEGRDYPLVAGHSAFRDRAPKKDEYQRRLDQLERMKERGGMVAVGLHQGEILTFGGRVPSDAPGSTKSWAQAYLYAIEHMGRERVGLGTDINGFEGKVAPRFGLNACYDINKGTHGESEERKLLRREYVYAQANGVRYDQPIRDYRAYRFEGVLYDDVYNMEERDIWEAIALFASGADPNSAESPPTTVRDPWRSGKIKNIAKGFRATSRNQLENPFLGGNTFNEQLAAYLVHHGQNPSTSDSAEVKRLHPVIKRIWERWQGMQGSNAPLRRSYAGPQRDFDINIDGVAHYGLLPDFLQDLKNVGLTNEDLAPLFRSAEDYIQLWEKCERLSEREPGGWPEIALRQVARERLGINGGFSVIRDVFGVPQITGLQSLRARLEQLT
jgi:microsomal dipeptidase-like Zn-dependent dipeptidase